MVAGPALESCPPQRNLHVATWSLPPDLSAILQLQRPGQSSLCSNYSLPTDVQTCACEHITCSVGQQSKVRWDYWPWNLHFLYRCISSFKFLCFFCVALKELHQLAPPLSLISPCPVWTSQLASSLSSTHLPHYHYHFQNESPLSSPLTRARGAPL